MEYPFQKFNDWEKALEDLSKWLGNGIMAEKHSMNDDP